MDEMDLLRGNAPIVRYNASELFHPTTVEAYVDQCALWEISPSGEHVRIADRGELDIDRLAQLGRLHADRALYLRFVQHPFNRWQYWKWRREGHYARMPHASRFANVGITTRILDAFFRLSLVLRRRLPKGTVSAGETQYRETMPDAPNACYARVVRDAGWTVCQYWYFYAVNDWRSSYNGINDHEADWETVNVYLAPDEHGDLRPRWVSSSSHDAEGDGLRRRVDDPDLDWHEGHLTLYAGAGSHSFSFSAADELIRVDAPRLKRFVYWTRRAIAVLTPWADSTNFQEGLGIPFVDYHRGDGLAIGRGGDRDWHLVEIGDDTPWVSEFRGRWGRDTGDRFGGESGPTGPRYERSGLDRIRWNDPVGWAGLQKVSPDPLEAHAILAGRIDEITGLIHQIDADMDERREQARREMVQAQAMDIDTTTAALARMRYSTARQDEDVILALAEERRQLSAERASIARASVEGLPATGTRDHLRARAVAETCPPQTLILRAWSAVSTSVLLAIIVWLLVANDYTHYWLGVVVGIVALVGVESAARGRVLQFVMTLVVIAVFVVVLIGFLAEWRITLAIIVGLCALYLMFENLRELFNR